MATLYISYFGTVHDECAAHPLASETITTSTTSARSGAIPTGAKIAAITSDTAHYVCVGLSADSPVATATNGFYLPANGLREIAVNIQGNALKIAAITLA